MISVQVYAAGALVREAVVAKLRQAEILVAAAADTVVVAAGGTIDEALTACPATLRAAGDRLIVAADTLSPAGVLRAFRAGARILLQTPETTPAQFSAAVHSAVHGESRLPYGLLVRLLSGGAELSLPIGVHPVAPLTERQLTVLTLMADGHGNADIARKLSCSEHTVKNVIYELMARLQVRNRAHAVAHAVRAGLI
ncbi:helix-turn-helix transcriptional regulator [Amycolatopsis alba]|uniref:Helix-turn-helix transcriptional regulator n=1 Tax=Amycolatopsis alba DSM 44262 TaxID=1125972 RepID=A0A229RFC1_AMYAL|nr:LuxR C-terminal-related transcriptional regulator [Amycolatopsis alba]OXM45347.1 helix-turn-helix transcriptional regulator [Amycolatopsis alba DSM 44262]